MKQIIDVKDMVRERYAQIAEQSKEDNAASCCGVGAPCTTNIMVDSYADISGYNADAGGFEGITVQKQKPIMLPDELLLQFLTADEVRQFVASGTGIFSVTVFAQKPGETAPRPVVAAKEACCAPGSGCC